MKFPMALVDLYPLLTSAIVAAEGSDRDGAALWALVAELEALASNHPDIGPLERANAEHGALTASKRRDYLLRVEES